MKTIALSNGMNTMVDAEDFEFFNKFVWHLNKQGYVSHAKYRLHRAILFAEKGDIVDHIDHNPLNNQKSNLRLVKTIENLHNKSLSPLNKSGMCGVSWHIKLNKWQAMIKVDYKQIFLGNFDSKEDAIKAREVANIRYKFHKNHGLDIPKEIQDVNQFKKDDLRGFGNTRHRFICFENRKNHSRYKVSVFISKGNYKYVGSFKTLELAIEARDLYLKSKE